MTNELANTDLENAVISLILQNPTEEFDIDGLRYFMFSSTVNQTLFQEIEGFREKGVPPDVALFVNSLEKTGKISKVGGDKNYIDYLMKLDYNKDNFFEYVKAIVENHKTRSFISLASKIKPETVKSGEIDETIYKFKEELDSLSNLSGDDGTLHISNKIRESFDEIASRREHKGIRGVSWGMHEVDRLSGGKIGGELWYISGRPGSGKSALILNSILADAKAGIPVLLFQREMSYQSMIERFLSIETGIGITNIRQGILDQEQIDKVYSEIEVLRTYPIYIDVSFKLSNTGYMESVVSRYKKKHGIKIVYADYIQLLAERDEGATNELGRISRSFKIMANNLDVCSVIVSQLNRGVESRDNKRPVLSDLRQSGNLEEDADFVVGLYRDEYYNPETKLKNLMEFIVLKARNAQTGTITLKFDSATNKIGEPE